MRVVDFYGNLWQLLSLPEVEYEVAEAEIWERFDFDLANERFSDAMVYGTKCTHPNENEIRKEIDKINSAILRKIEKRS